MQRRLNESTEKYQKVKKTAMNLPIMLNFQKRAFQLRVFEKVPKGDFTRPTKSEHISWECPKKQDNSKFYKKVKNRLCIVKIGDGHCIKIYKNKKIGGFITPAIKYANSTYDEKMPKATICDTCHADPVTSEVRSGARGAHFLRKLLWIHGFWKINVFKMDPGEVGVRDGIGG